MSDYPRAKVQAVLDDPAAPMAKVAAARHVLGMCENGYSKSGKPLAIEDLREALDRSLGKPAQTVHMKQEITADPESTWAQLVEYLGDKPHLLAKAAQQLGRPVLPDTGRTDPDPPGPPSG